ncbi:AMP-binding protein [Parendozoicomonas sp. Alg238-R29]|uniref:AMP-binding protein n=1 Tax=Parendozoicomonas sp. Alg238-R29 TaxID=2993446 RepID=UPI00248DAA9E|nr:AMP-binding protein [Parendozoicomonas sp. Alg238-R29]
MSLTECLHRGVSMYGEKKALVFEDRTTTYTELHHIVSKFAGALTNLGLERESRIGILTLNCDRAISCFYGASWGGFIPNYLNMRWSAHELAASIEDCSASVLVVDDIFLPMGIALKKLCPSIKALIYVGESNDIDADVLSFNELIEKAEAIEDQSGGGSDIAFLNYTGGTTGKGKGVAHSHRAHISGMTVVMAERLFLRGTTCLAVPLFHIGGISVCSANLLAGNTIVVSARFEPDVILQLITRHYVEHMFMVPTMLKMLIEQPTFHDQDMTCLRHIAYGASPIDETLLQNLQEKMPWASFMQIYGQTECVPAAFLHNCDHTEKGRSLGRTRSAGRACLGVDIEIRNQDGEPLPAGEIGEIALRSEHRMVKYWNNPEQTSEAMKGEWLLTGDAGYLSEDGYLHIVDRVKDMIISGGENIYSLEVENVICLHTAVAQCAVVGLPDKKWGEVVHAEIVLKPGIEINESELTSHCRKYLGGYKIARSMKFVSEIPVTAVGKIDKVAIRNRYAETNS